MAINKEIPEHAIAANNLLDHLLKIMLLKNDAALARAMELAPPVISKMRHGRLSVCASFIINAHEVSGMSIRDIKSIAGLPSYKLSSAQEV